MWDILLFMCAFMSLVLMDAINVLFVEFLLHTRGGLSTCAYMYTRAYMCAYCTGFQ